MTDAEKNGRMGKDRAQKCLEEHNEVFADIFNNLVFKEDLIQPEELTHGPTESIYKAEGCTALKEQRRDVCKYVRRFNATVSLLGIENQMTVDLDMGIRVLGYDYGSYRHQIGTGSERYAAITAVLYYGKEPWRGVRSLKQRLSIPKKLARFVNDYKYVLIDVPRLPKSSRERLTSDFKVVADFFAEKDSKDYIPSRQEIKHVEEVLYMLRTFTGDKRYEEIEHDIMECVRRGEPVRMCDFAERMEQKGRGEGRAEGIQALIEDNLEDGKSEAVILEKLRKHFGLTEEQAREYFGRFAAAAQ
ncbi:MAG: Rpn family recombination-promoting nuclease/putative transposase [Lachnospiraceae bacterium]|nr:Rpn family recombination-promoting nuclease/putative transposase [Lachnospiraceae bacterium]